MMRNKWQVIFGTSVIVLAVFLRTCHVGDWLHYELDQARDFRIVAAAIEYGPGELPLQGPKAAGNVVIADATGALTDKTTLRLGPLFYYIEYVSVLLFGATPLGSVVLIVILSIATVPLVYVFLRRFFYAPLALGLSALVASSLFFVTYSRFGWNPNLIPFFMTFFAYSLLRVTDLRDAHRGWWLIVAAGALAFVGQMHFLAFIAAPVIGVAYLLWSWRAISGKHRLPWRFWFVAVALFALLQVPLALNDWRTGGENTKAFVAALTQKSEKDTHTLPEKIVRNAANHVKYYWIVITGDQRAEIPTLSDWDIRCDHSCRVGLWRGAVVILLIAGGKVAWFMAYRRERSLRRRDFLRMSALWISVVFALYIPLAYNMAPRFFLLQGVMFVVLFGLFVQMLLRLRYRGVTVLAWTLIGTAVVANLFFVWQDFAQRARAATDASLRIPTDYILKEKTRMPFTQMQMIMAHIARRSTETGFPVWLHAQPEFKRAFWERIDAAGIGRFGAPTDLSRAYRNGLYFLIIRTQSKSTSYVEKIKDHADIVDIEVFGTLTLYEFTPHDDVIVADNPSLFVKRRDPRFSSSVQKRYLWRQVFDRED